MAMIKCIDYIQTYLKIKTKEGVIIPFLLNEPQKKVYEIFKEEAKKNKPIRIIIPKARQMGMSTLIEAIMFYRTITNFNVSSGIIAHKAEATDNLYAMTKLYFNYLPSFLQPEILASNAKEIVFDTRDNKGLGSKIVCMTAEGQGQGRSHTLKNLHLSEYAWWRNKVETRVGLMSSVPSTKDSMVVIESTANGFDDFRDLCYGALNGENEWRLVFLAWHEMKTYRMPYDNFELTKEEEKLKEKYNLDNEQLAWRRYQINTVFSGDINLFNQEYPSCLEDAFISTGNCPFAKNNIIDRLQEVEKIKPFKVGNFVYDMNSAKQIIDSTIKFSEDREGYIKLYKDVEHGRPYVIGGDTSGEGSDYFTSHVLDNITGEQVAVFKKQNDEDYYTNQMYCLGKYYNNALIGIESNFSTYPNKILDETLDYKKMFYRETEDTYKTQYKKSFGFRTTSITKPLIIQMLASITRESIKLINDAETLREMLEFIKDESGKYHAIEGKHDDLVMALAIAYYIRSTGQQNMRISEENNNKELNYVGEMLDKFYNQQKKKGRTIQW